MRKFSLSVFYLMLFTLSGFGQTDLNHIAQRYVEDYKLPGVAISVIKPNEILYGLSGFKRVDKDEQIEMSSAFHIGSNTKAITAMVAAKLVEDDIIQWNTSIADLFPDLMETMHPAYKEVSLGNLLSNRGRIQAFEDMSEKSFKSMPKSIETSENGLEEFVSYVLSLPPVDKLDSNKEHSYSNAGFSVASLMMERASGKSYEDLIKDLFDQYGLEHMIGFPSQLSASNVFGHKKGVFRYKPVAPNKEFNLGKHLSPAGNLSLSIEDLSFLVSMHLKGLMGEHNYLSSETYQKLHFGLDDYAYGWYNGKIGDTQQQFSYHGGSLGTFTSAILLSADRQVAVIVLLNADGKKAYEMKNALRTYLWETYGTKD